MSALELITTEATDERRGKHSASSMEADSLCVGRFNAIASMPKQEEKRDEYAAHGDKVHKMLCDWFSTRDVVDYITATDEEKETFEQCRNEAEAEIKKFIGEDMLPHEIHVEERLWGLKGPNEFSGKPDLVVRIFGKMNTAGRTGGFPSRAMILDFKSLWGEHAEDASNLQLRSLAVLVFRNYAAQSVYVKLIQPKVKRKGEGCLYDERSLMLAQKQIADIISKSRKGKKRTAGKKQCAYCPFKKQCEEYAFWVRGDMPVAIQSLPVNARDWTPEQRGVFLDREGEARKWIEARKAELKALCKEQPDAVDGWMLDKGKKSPKILDVKGAFASLSSQLSSEEFLACCSAGVTKLADALAKKLETSKDAARTYLYKVLGDNIETTEGEQIFVRKK